MRTGSVVLMALLTLAVCTSALFTQRPHVGAKDMEGQTAQWFTQTLDHFESSDTRTFQQKYYVNSTWFKAGGPIVLYISGEGPCSGIHPNDFTLEMAEALSGMVVTLEHRFYGASQPFSTLTTANLKYLTSSQALADWNAFRNHLASENPGSKFVIVGGSYSGALSAFFREKYPDAVEGAVSSSGVVHAILDFYEFDEQVAKSAGPTCTLALQNITGYIESQLAGGAEANAAVKSVFGAEELLDGDFLYMMADTAAELIQYGYYAELCTPLVESWVHSGTPEELLQLFAGIYKDTWEPNLNPGGPQEYSTKYGQRVDTEDSAGRSWWWEKCNEFAFFQVAPSSNSIRSSQIDLAWHRQRCEALFGQGTWPDVNETNQKYGALGLHNATNVVFTQGSADPWQRAGISTSSPQRGFEAQVIECVNCGHCVDLRGCPSAGPHTAGGCAGNGSQELVAWRKVIVETVGKWVGQ